MLLYFDFWLITLIICVYGLHICAHLDTLSNGASLVQLFIELKWFLQNCFRARNKRFFLTPPGAPFLAQHPWSLGQERVKRLKKSHKMGMGYMVGLTLQKLL